MYQRVAGR